MIFVRADNAKCIAVSMLYKRYHGRRRLRRKSYVCEGCGVCEYVCPVGAIKMIPKIAGEGNDALPR